MSHHGKTFREILGIVVFNRDNGSSVYIDKSEITPDIHPCQAVGEFPCLIVLAGDNDSPRMVGESVFPFFGDDGQVGVFRQRGALLILMGRGVSLRNLDVRFLPAYFHSCPAA